MKLYHAIPYRDYTRSVRLGKIVAGTDKPVLLSPTSPRDMLEFPYLYHRNKDGWVILTIDIARKDIDEDTGHDGYTPKRVIPMSSVTRAVYARGRTPDVKMTKRREDGALYHLFEHSNPLWGVVATKGKKEPMLLGYGPKHVVLKGFQEIDLPKVKAAWPWDPPKKRDL